MTLRWIEGFSASYDEVLLERLYDSIGASNSVAVEAGVDGVSSGAVVSDDLHLRTKALVGSVSNEWVLGFAFRTDIEQDDITGAGVALHNSTGEQLRVETVGETLASSKPGGTYYRWRVVRGATVLATSNELFEALDNDAGWYFFEFKATVANSGGQFEMRYRKRLGGGSTFQTVTWDSASTGLDTQNQATSGVDRVSICWDTTTGGIARNVVFDEFYALDTLGATNNDYLGGMVIEALSPAADGAQLDWVLAGGASDIEDAWNESPGTFNDDKRVTSDTTNDITLADMSGMTLIQDSTPISCVRFDLHGRMESATGSLSLFPRYRTAAGTQGDAAGADNFTVANTTPAAGSFVLEQQPVDSVAWTKTELDSGQWGVRNGG